ncbi:MAG: prephenate dehydrogenase [Clostridia bacterium]|nr:prephenate dehydrogenase [Clostridia bacterium]
MFSTVGIVGFGLIGGSMGAALKKNSDIKIIAIDKDESVVDYAVKNGMADEGSVNPSEALPKCDVVFIALYPELTKTFIKENKDVFKKGSVVSDLCGIKSEIVSFVNSLGDVNFRFVGAHPMAGKEINGVTAADDVLYQGASLLITPDEKTDRNAVEIIRRLGEIAGFGRIVEASPKRHDEIITYTSQLPHVMSVAYVLQNTFDKCDGFYAGSFEDMARVAKINENLWSELFALNRDTLNKQIDEYVSALLTLKEQIGRGDYEILKETLKKSRELKEWKDENYKR